MKTPWIFCFLFFLFDPASAQVSKIKYGKVSPEDLAMKTYAPDPEANAVILSKIGFIRYDPLQERYALSEEVHVVVKILKETGLDEFGNVALPYYAYDNYSKISNLKAMVHLPDGTEIKVENNQIIDEQTNEYWSSKKIAFPQLIPGAIIEYQYILLSNGMYQPVDWFFQDKVPIVYAELKTYIPEWFEYVVLTQGSPLDKQTSDYKNETLNISNINRGLVTSLSTKDKGEITYTSLDIRFISHTYANMDVPALKEECCITTMDDYYSRVRFQLKAYQFPNSSREPVMNSWMKLATELFEIPEWGGQFKNKRPGESVLEAAGVNPSSTATQMETAQKVYNYIITNIQWNGFYGTSTRKDINTILKEKRGNSGDLNKLMCAALIQSGIQAKPVLISTRDHGKPLELYPFSDQFNHLIVLAKIDAKDVWIDLGEKNRPLGLLRSESLNSRGWLVDQLEPAWIDLSAPESKTIFLIKGNLDSEGNLHGNLETRFTGYHAIEYRNMADDENEKPGNQLLVNGTIPITVDEIELINQNEPSLPLQLKGKIKSHPLATITPEKIYISSVFPKGMDEIPFKLEERTYPIEMNYPSEISMILNVGLPEGYVVESLPEPIRFVTENNGIQVTYEAVVAAGKINITMKYVIKQLHFESTEYGILKNIYNQRHQKYNEQIVLAKTP
jgi:Domain of Unknown Function with PDB structure (DUF3857)/Transglutaminase-like superfamily